MMISTAQAVDTPVQEERRREFDALATDTAPWVLGGASPSSVDDTAVRIGIVSVHGFGTPTTAEERSREATSRVEPTEEQRDVAELLGLPITPAERECHTRLAMLARRYVSSHYSPEDDARFLLATERLRRLMPRTTLRDMERLEELASATEEDLAANADLRKELGLDD